MTFASATDTPGASRPDNALRDKRSAPHRPDTPPLSAMTIQYRRQAAPEGVRPITRHARSRWTTWIGTALSAAVFAACLLQLRLIDLAKLAAIVPTSIGFWLAITVFYFSLPVCEWIIFRLLWRLPVVGIVPLLRKRVSNEILFGYSGDVYFYTWVRQRQILKTTPFGAIKDVAILSAQVGNAVTFALLAILWWMLPSLGATRYSPEILGSCAIVALMTVPVILFRDRLFSLPRQQLRRVALVQFVRVASTPLLNAIVWHEALPHVAMAVWIGVAALRQLLSRLPFMPGKDLAFAGMISLMVGANNAIVLDIALCGSLVLLFDVAIGLALGASGALFPPRDAPPGAPRAANAQIERAAGLHI